MKRKMIDGKAYVATECGGWRPETLADRQAAPRRRSSPWRDCACVMAAFDAAEAGGAEFTFTRADLLKDLQAVVDASRRK